MERVSVYEVGPRDGLQNESVTLSTQDKLAFIEQLVAAGVRDIEVSSFVRPRWIPQLADADQVVGALPDVEGVTYWGLVPNKRGLDRAVGVEMKAVATFMSVSETHNLKNVNRSTSESLMGLREVIADARAEGLRVRSYLSTVFGCPYEGKTDPQRTVDLSLALLEAGAERISLGDTTGMGNPRQVQEIIRLLGEAGVGPERVTLHMHDTRGTALANILAGLEAGVRQFDTSVAGLGGCPYAPGASGNAASEDLVYMLTEMGYQTGIDLPALSNAGLFVEDMLGRPLPGRYHQAWRAQCQAAAQAKEA
ncbi:MAG: hydroxymethylglutaryl-CoA lyase [Myxococcota bacterium]|nr:hydroxymethylglutaryl-CoA lyase [Myxococcota bacterium]